MIAPTQDALPGLRPAPRLRGLWYRHAPPAALISSQYFRILGGRLLRRFYDTTGSPMFRWFLAAEAELGERVAACLMLP